MRKFAVFIITCITAIALFGCGMSTEKALEKSEAAVSKQFSEKKETNTTAGNLKLYLNSKLQVDEEMENNVLLLKGDHPIVLFHNPIVEPSSDQLFEQAKNTDGKIIQEKTFTHEDDNDELGYLLIIDHGEEKEEDYEVIVGIGGVKATTNAKTKELEELTGLMMEVVASVELAE